MGPVVFLYPALPFPSFFSFHILQISFFCYPGHPLHSLLKMLFYSFGFPTHTPLVFAENSIVILKKFTSSYKAVVQWILVHKWNIWV